jgi:hypothetical protein
VIGKFIQSNLRLDKLLTQKGREGRFVLSREKTSVGLGKLIVGYDQTKRTFIINTENIHLSHDFRKRLSDLLDVMVPQKIHKRKSTTYTSKGLRSQINKYILEVFPEGESKDVLMEVMKSKD